MFTALNALSFSGGKARERKLAENNADQEVEVAELPAVRHCFLGRCSLIPEFEARVGCCTFRLRTGSQRSGQLTISTSARGLLCMFLRYSRGVLAALPRPCPSVKGLVF